MTRPASVSRASISHELVAYSAARIAAGNPTIPPMMIAIESPSPLNMSSLLYVLMIWKICAAAGLSTRPAVAERGMPRRRAIAERGGRMRRRLG